MTHSTHGILLPLLPSGSDGFHKATLREAQQNCQSFTTGCQRDAGPSRQYLYLALNRSLSSIRYCILPLRRATRRGASTQCLYLVPNRSLSPMGYCQLPLSLESGGEGGIRTLGRGKPTHAFQACALNRSATSPIFQEKNLHHLSPPLVNIKQRGEFKFQRLQKHNYSHTNRR